MSRLLPLTLTAFLGTFLVAACSGSTVVTTSAADDGGAHDGAPRATDDDGATTDADEADSASSASFGTTADGKSCDPGTFAPTTTCAIPGTYDVVESDCSGGACGSGVEVDDRWTAEVTVSGTSVKLSNGNNRLLHCELTSECDCTSSSGELYRFSNTGFLSTGKADCGKTIYYLTAGTKR